jgi:hypothetical protein
LFLLLLARLLSAVALLLAHLLACYYSYNCLTYLVQLV